MNKHLFLFLMVALGAAGCASVESGTAQEPREETVYRTGSNIPQKQRAGSPDGVSTYGREELGRARDSAYTPPPPTSPRPGG